MANSEIDLTHVAYSEVKMIKTLDADTQVIATFDVAGATQGAGTIMVEYC